MKPQSIILAGKLGKLKQLKDGRLSISFMADAPTESQLSTLTELNNVALWCQLSGDNEMSIPDKAPPPLTGGVSDSQRMRLALQSLWSSRYSDQPFEEFYHKQMERIINKIMSANQRSQKW